ncbi:MAG: MFS transporter [Thaumarchaeota archaeon]|nr:MFS transporter [Nitrososphaerota archaeon]
MDETTNRAVAALVAARLVYAVNWLNIGAIFYLMGTDLSGGVSGLGTLTSSFYLGVGLLQVPGGLFAAKWGPKMVVTLGIMMSSFAVLGSAISSNIPEVAVFRFIVGAGMAFVFAPAVVLLARFVGSKSGIGVGLFNSTFGVGGIFGLFGWIVLASATGWRPSLLLSGILGVLTAILVVYFVPRDEGNLGSRLALSELRRIFEDRNLILLGFGTMGITLGNTLVSSFMAFYLHEQLGETPALAGLISALMVVMPIFSALWGGRLYDRMKKPRLLMLAALLAMIVALLLCALPNLIGAAVGSALGGAAFGVGLTVSFAAAKDLHGTQKEYDGVAIAWVNSLSLTSSFWPPLVFSYLAESLGYAVAWFGGACLSLLFLVPLVFLPDKVRDEVT